MIMRTRRIMRRGGSAAKLLGRGGVCSYGITLKPKRVNTFLVLLGVTGLFYLIDCLVAFGLKVRPDLPWIESGIFTGGPFLLTVGCALCAFLSLALRLGITGVQSRRRLEE
jgi:hypothetical protein